MTAIVLIAVVLVAGFGYWIFSPRVPTQIPVTTEQTSVLTPQRTYVSSTMSQAGSSGTTVWLNVSAIQQVNYYLELLELNGTDPYVQLARELRRLPNATNAAAVAKIAYLALDATNSEVKEAFQLMMKGGTPYGGDFSYPVPNYNTELQVLYWLAESAEFKRDDTLVLAIAMTHGIWITEGDNEVRQSVRNDVSDFLVFLRETSQFQDLRGYFSLEKYPLEAKVCLAWRGDQSSVRSYHDPRDYLSKRMDTKAYRWATIEVGTLIQMRDLMDKKGWVGPKVMSTVTTLESLFFTRSNSRWIYPKTDDVISINGQDIANHNFNSADLEFTYYSEYGDGIGWCSDEMGFLNALCKSWGIATTSLWGDRIVNGEKLSGHTHVIFFDPRDRTWRADPAQLQIDVDSGFNSFFIFKPKITLTGFPESNRGAGLRYVFSKFVMNQTHVAEIRTMFLLGVEASQMKQWLLYT